MAEDANKPAKPADQSTVHLRQEVKDPATGATIGRAETEFPSAAVRGDGLSFFANTYKSIGANGLITTVVCGAFAWLIQSSIANQQAWIEASVKQQEALNNRVDRLWDESAKERAAMTSRYLDQREATEKRHAELMSAVQKAILYMDISMNWFFKEQQRKGGPAMPPPPKAADVPG